MVYMHHWERRQRRSENKNPYGFYKKATLKLKTHIKVNGWSKINYANTNQKKARIVTLFWQSRLQNNKVIGNKEEHYIKI